MTKDLKFGDLLLVRNGEEQGWKLATFVLADNPGAVVAKLWDVKDDYPAYYRYWRGLPAPVASDLLRQENGQYMLSVDGERAPSRIHDSLESAEREAERLIRERNVPVVRILRLEKTLRRKVVIEEE